MAFCSNCGSQTPEGSDFCAQCGNKLSPAAPQTEPVYEQPPQVSEQPPQVYEQPPQVYEQPPAPTFQTPPPAYQAPQPPVYQAPPPGYQPPPPGYQPPPPGYQVPVQKGFVGEIYSNAFKLLFSKPIRLWGLSLLFSVIMGLTFMLTIAVPIVYVAVALVLELGMASIYLNGYRGKEISATQLFEGFSSKFFRNAGGMGWRSLWLIIWWLVPVVGWIGILPIIKSYAYRFVPYIMLNEPGITATEALKKSMSQTNGYKGKMFLADLFIMLGVIVLSIIFGLISMIPILGMVLLVIYTILLCALLPLLMGILSAAYYDKILADNPDRN